MPKEYVFQRTKHGDPDTQSNVVKIGWAKDYEYVEVQTVSTDKTLSVCQLVDGEWKPIHELGEQGFAAHLTNRRDINRFISILKRARDQAFGKDE